MHHRRRRRDGERCVLRDGRRQGSGRRPREHRRRTCFLPRINACCAGFFSGWVLWFRGLVLLVSWRRSTGRARAGRFQWFTTSGSRGASFRARRASRASYCVSVSTVTRCLTCEVDGGERYDGESGGKRGRGDKMPRGAGDEETVPAEFAGGQETYNSPKKEAFSDAACLVTVGGGAETQRR